MDATDCDYLSKTQYNTNLNNRTVVICFKFHADLKPALVTPLQSESYPKASSNLYNQSFIKWTKETRLLENNSASGSFFISLFLTWL